MVSWQDFTLIIIYMMNSPLIKPIYIIFHGTQGLKMAFTVELADTFSISPIVLVASTVHLISSQSSSYSTRSTQYLAAHAKHHNFVDVLIHRHDNIIYEQEYDGASRRLSKYLYCLPLARHEEYGKTTRARAKRSRMLEIFILK